ncbi:hypothetical protein [Bradyrhizobium sp. CCGE-LA001]|uniref:hypothetical protein n=1 Tax=Bradyrhizobium sp. CCGE-LA001 TaxID=1223566 RepID=UPI0011981F37|nr:hypothetical protein [Bradyrhizobium sp. CCGE-LA001]
MFFIIDERIEVVIHMDLSKFQVRRRSLPGSPPMQVAMARHKSDDLSGTSGTVVWQNHLIDDWTGQAILD